MGDRGYSLIEMVVTVSIVSVLIAIGTLSFSQYLDRSRTESQTRMIYTELLKSRAEAVYERRVTRMKLYPRRFDIYSSSCDDSTVEPAAKIALQFPVLCQASSGDAENGYLLGFKDNGIASASCSICVENENSAPVDSVVISYARVSIGKRQKGKDCHAENITIH